MSIPGIRKNDKRLTALVTEISLDLSQGKKHVVAGLGTFSACSRKAGAGNPACTIAMFRACTELRDYAEGGTKPKTEGTHAPIVQIILNAMKTQETVDIPRFGRLAMVKDGKKTKLIFHGADELNGKLGIK
ncbi:MAG: hypothetical protein OEZ68_12100 [Gammaproteobacteria bacterium]|nr:hypothetical protein [Gammaproteobacteria bacterium]MDH5801536.1 hypothetical protein [Gammaproteobacteria bacterium]